MAGLALEPHTDPALYRLLGLETKIRTTIADIADRDALEKAVTTHRPDVLIHLAAQAIVGQAHHNAYDTWRVNALGTVAVLEAAANCGTIRATLVFTTDKVYDNDESGRAFTENDPVGGLGIYDSSKGAAELAVRAFLHGGKLEPGKGLAAIRAGNVVGGGDWGVGRLAPDCVKAFVAGQAVTLRHPDSVRPWQHVMDVCHATQILAQAMWKNPQRFSGAWNMGPDTREMLTVAQMAEALADSFGQREAWIRNAEAVSFPEAQHLLLDSTKLRHALKWCPVLPVREALDWTGRWYKAWHNGADAVELTEQDMAAFERVAMQGMGC